MDSRNQVKNMKTYSNISFAQKLKEVQIFVRDRFRGNVTKLIIMHVLFKNLVLKNLQNTHAMQTKLLFSQMFELKEFYHIT